MFLFNLVKTTHFCIFVEGEHFRTTILYCDKTCMNPQQNYEKLIKLIILILVDNIQISFSAGLLEHPV